MAQKLDGSGAAGVRFQGTVTISRRGCSLAGRSCGAAHWPRRYETGPRGGDACGKNTPRRPDTSRRWPPATGLWHRGLPACFCSGGSPCGDYVGSASSRPCKSQQRGFAPASAADCFAGESAANRLPHDPSSLARPGRGASTRCVIVPNNPDPAEVSMRSTSFSLASTLVTLQRHAGTHYSTYCEHVLTRPFGQLPRVGNHLRSP